MACLIAGFLAFAIPASASPIVCPGTPLTVDTFLPAGPSSVSFACGGLTFSNFEVVLASGNLAVGQVDLVTASNNNGDVVLGFNPNLINATGTGFVDLWFFYEVTGATNGIDLTVRGQNATVTETACSTPIDRVNGNICTSGLLAQLAVVTNSSGVGRKDVAFPSVSGQTYIFKDINVGPGGDLTSFSESHASVPEPATLPLIGGALLGLAALLRRKFTAC